jgi:polygalacturonase
MSAGVVRADELTLRSMGAVGDGKTDDRAAIQAALIKAAGAVVDGEGATYAILGNITVHNDVNLRNANFIQTMRPIDISEYIPSAQGKGQLTVDPPESLRKMIGTLPVLHANGIATYSDDVVLSDEQTKVLMRTIDLNTLSISGTKDKPVSVRMEKIKINRGKFPETGDDNCAGVFMSFASPIVMNNMEITGNGKGTALSMRNCAKVQLERINIHDMIWAPFLGDNVFQVASAKSIKEDFGWNNFPLYSFRGGEKRFVRMRVREQIAGVLIVDTNDVQIVDSKIERLQAKIGGRLYPLQADGLTVTGVNNLLVRNCQFSKVWEGIDMTGSMCDGILIEDCTATDTLTFGFKLAHPKRNVKLVNCTSIRAGNTGFVMQPEVENIEFIRCRALETGGSGYWIKDDGQRLGSTKGFSLDTNSEMPTPPLRVHFENCAVINKKFPNTLDIGFLCEAGINPAERDITAFNCTVIGAAKDFQGIVVK